jgi:predicted  nucleic acid-binding Zn-ribbon protein
VAQIEVTQADVQSVMQANPLMAVQVENAALKRRIEELNLAFQTSMNEVTRLGMELEKLTDGKSKEKK